ncbi:uncharacterized protein LOC124200964 [Daphnia pulex]|uniref:uncharacterized protein LOC124200964 n=1 Tax=Daphnia pulex TaxID=6669 RepID=UPI001EDE0BEF|nr:uncharacterized protein LOC124200964 [Daphnia pulex]
MRVYLLVCAIFCILLALQECQAQKKKKKFNFTEDKLVPCGGRNSRQVDVRSSRQKRRAAEVIIATFKRDSFGCDEQGPKTLIKHKDVRIDLQDSRWFEKRGKRWRNLQLQLNQQRVPGFPTTVATVLMECDKQFPMRYVRNAFVRSMTKCVHVWLD